MTANIAAKPTQKKCICIDPPYNTGDKGWIYSDNVDRNQSFKA